MPFDAGDIEKLKASVPERYRGVSESGTLSGRFLADSVPESTALQGKKLDLFNLGQGFVNRNTDDAAPSFILGNSQNIAHIEHLAHVEKTRRADLDFALDILRRDIEERDRKLAENLARIKDLDDYEAGLDDHLAALRRGEKPAMVNGKLKDKRAEDAVAEYERKYGIKVDRNDERQIMLVLAEVQEEKARRIVENVQLLADRERDSQTALAMGASPEAIEAMVQDSADTKAARQALNHATMLSESVEVKQAVIAAKDYNDADTALALEAIDDSEGFDDAVTVEGVALKVSAASDSVPTNLGAAPDMAGAFGASAVVAKEQPTPAPTPEMPPKPKTS